MRRLLLLSPMALLSACVVRAYDTRPAPVVYQQPGPVVVQPTYYQYNGEHPLPESEGGGWCDIEGVHQHPFAPDSSYQYQSNTYVYAAPRVVWYYGFHPIPGGGYCYLEGRHSHGYLPSREYRSNFVWTPGNRYYAYHGPYVRPGVHTVAMPPNYTRPGTVVQPTYNPPPTYHSPYGSGPAYTPPPPGHVGGYTPGPIHVPPPNTPPGGGGGYPPPSNGGPYVPPGGQGPGSPPGGPYGGGAGNPPPGHGGPIPGHGGTPPGQGNGGPPGHQNNPGHGGYDPGPNPPGGGHGNGPHGPPPGHGPGVKVQPKKTHKLLKF